MRNRRRLLLLTILHSVYRQFQLNEQFSYKIIIQHNKENLESYDSNKDGRGGKSGTYLRQTIGVVGSAGERRKT